jgi:ribosomal protein S27AE
MSTTRQTMMCPKCGAAMNAHAEKPVEPRNAEEANAVAMLVIEEVHQCPGCGNVESRRVFV